MKTVYSAPNITLVSLYKDILEASGIPCMIRNELLTGSAGQLQAIECWPELCVADDDFAEASRLIEDVLSKETGPNNTWKCSSCGEEMEGQFTECWKCGKSRTA
jgi:hypothetical protein